MKNLAIVFCSLLCLSLSQASPPNCISIDVVDEAGQPLSGVGLCVGAIEELRDGKWNLVMRSGAAFWYTNDSRGHFQLRLQEPVRYDIHIHKPGFAPTFLFQVDGNS